MSRVSPDSTLLSMNHKLLCNHKAEPCPFPPSVILLKITGLQLVMREEFDLRFPSSRPNEGESVAGAVAMLRARQMRQVVGEDIVFS